MHTTMLRISAVCLASSLALLAGCASQSKPSSLYGWYRYEAQLDQWFRKTETSPQVQLKTMQDDLQRMQSAGEKPPPGFHAHMGMLHAELGDPASFKKQLEIEKSAFPEGGAYIDFLLRNFKRP